jgi:hypothetical protein
MMPERHLQLDRGATRSKCIRLVYPIHPMIATEIRAVFNQHEALELKMFGPPFQNHREPRNCFLRVTTAHSPHPISVYVCRTSFRLFLCVCSFLPCLSPRSLLLIATFRRGMLPTAISRRSWKAHKATTTTNTFTIHQTNTSRTQASNQSLTHSLCIVDDRRPLESVDPPQQRLVACTVVPRAVPLVASCAELRPNTTRSITVVARVRRRHSCLLVRLSAVVTLHRDTWPARVKLKRRPPCAERAEREELSRPTPSPIRSPVDDGRLCESTRRRQSRCVAHGGRHRRG